MDRIPNDAPTRDLSRLVQRRTLDAINSVAQLTDSTGQAYVVALAAANTAVGFWAAMMEAHRGIAPGTTDLPAAFEALAQVLRGVER